MSDKVGHMRYKKVARYADMSDKAFLYLMCAHTTVDTYARYTTR